MAGNSDLRTSRRRASQVDVFAFPGIRTVVGTWRKVIFANRAARREAKAVLFAELAEAAKRRVSLAEALRMCSQTVREAEKSLPWLLAPKGADTRQWIPGWFLAFALILANVTGGAVYAILSFRFVDVERIARILALRLLERVEAGDSISEAMEQCPGDFDPDEVEVVRAGVEWNRVPAALKRLSEYQVTENRLTLQGSQMLYPFLLFCLLTMPLLFFAYKILPKYQDLFMQLGAELPSLTRRLVGVFRITGGPVQLFGGLAALFLVFRALMNGNRISLLLVLFILAGGVTGAALGIAEDLSDGTRSFWIDPAAILMIVGGLFGLALVVLTPWILLAGEAAVLWVEKQVGSLIRILPFLHVPACAEAEARWLSALSLALEAGVPGPEAVAAAGRVCGGSTARRSRAAALRIEGGLSIGDACVAERVPSAKLAHRLVLIGVQSDFRRGLRAVAEDASQDAFEFLNRSGRIAEGVAVVGVGLVLVFFVLSMYLPLFSIPQMVGR